MERRRSRIAPTAAALCAVLLMVGTDALRAEVILYRAEDYTSGYSFSQTVRNFKDFVRTYWGTCYRGKEVSIAGPCEKKAGLNDDFRAIEITADETVELYEHKDFGGRHILYRGPTKEVLPAWFWDMTSSMAIHR